MAERIEAIIEWTGYCYYPFFQKELEHRGLPIAVNISKQLGYFCEAYEGENRCQLLNECRQKIKPNGVLKLK